MMLVAWELGIGSVPATVYDEALARSLLGYPAGQYCEYLLSFGYPADAVRRWRRHPGRWPGRRWATWSTRNAGRRRPTVAPQAGVTAT